MGLYRDSYVHLLQADEAAARLRALTDYWDARFGTTTEWQGRSGMLRGRALGLRFRSRFEVQPGRIDGELHVSALALRMGGRQYLMRKLDEYMDPAATLQQLRARVPHLHAGVCRA